VAVHPLDWILALGTGGKDPVAADVSRIAAGTGCREVGNRREEPIFTGSRAFC